ncbi:11-beta-hydroxysteroid dehydrogenase-like 6 isoform X2 [Gossypium arboreum]|uniref:11-beta-hydroxysteroid dehydrogenase-like 6 isoform X2 n=1 Tax=Gossypium arboreum TaxID=29729 RepID=UPI0022F1DCE4|nr:11-beta-hydroxysteroid dehydrogenase-like 6 isoform X2 [Gossypium arboreum]
MDMIDKFMHAVLSITFFVFFLHYRLFTSLVATARSLFKENVSGKVVLITGASSGIGEHVAYEYARRGACLAVVARREHRLRQVAAVCEIIGSPEAVYIVGDVAKMEDCQQFVEATVSYFGHCKQPIRRLDFGGFNFLLVFDVVVTVDHLVTNAGVTPEINFWGSVYSTYYAYGHLKKSKGKIIVIASSTGWLFAPRLSFYSASKAAVISFYETLRYEFGGDIGITIVTPGLIKTEMTDGKFLSKEARLQLDPEMRDVEISVMPLESACECGKAIVAGSCRGDNYLTVPHWYEWTKLWKVFCPGIMDRWIGFLLMPCNSHNEVPTKKLTHFVNGLTQFLSS